MKITDYGFWFKKVTAQIFMKKPNIPELHRVYFNRAFIGNYFPDGNYYVIYTPTLNKIGFTVNPRSPGEKNGVYWNFPNNYIPSDDDFIPIP